ncbi:hypothetical protein LTR53_010054 [Teratosphaeriaceae sp. CCFEE 6253]|nr:hypothetical protein LTR53_010054 [Teratosphaeriaceae sp. CCFEE 6253]
MPDSVSRHVTRKGNPLNLARTEVAQGLSDYHSSRDGSSQDSEVLKNTQLRRLGQGLGLIVRRWGQGLLLILGQDFSEDRILAPTDQAFEGLITLIDQTKGARISALSAAAFPILQDFRRGNQTTARLRLESADEDAILNLSRPSLSFEALLGPSHEE